jgi:triphosphoribosyl-dephospho-CoA synthase
VSGAPNAADIATAAQLACVLEATAPKPGNVSPGADFHDTSFTDFLASAVAIGPALGDAGSRPLGETILCAVKATRLWTASNTNLGIVLLLAPLAKAAATCDAPATVVSPDTLRASLHHVLAHTTVDDARHTYAAIRLASPGGLGHANEQDVAGDPTVSLSDAMRLARDRDGIAREYATDFQTTFELAVPTLARARSDALGWNDAIVETFLAILATWPDTHIVRRAGIELAELVSQRAREAIYAGGVRTADGRATISQMNTALRDDRNRANPGTTADITAAAIFVSLLGGGWHSAHASGGSDAAPR